MKIAFKYFVFAIISSLVNLLVQFISFSIYDGFFSIYVAIVFGTLAGLPVKYILDKKFIFYHTSKNKRDEGKKFILYSFMGVFTTLIFSGFEIGFYYLFPNENAKYIGAIIGLYISYTIKYYLDKKFVFIHNNK